MEWPAKTSAVVQTSKLTATRSDALTVWARAEAKTSEPTRPRSYRRGRRPIRGARPQTDQRSLAYSRPGRPWRRPRPRGAGPQRALAGLRCSLAGQRGRQAEFLLELGQLNESQGEWEEDPRTAPASANAVKLSQDDPEPSPGPEEPPGAAHQTPSAETTSFPPTPVGALKKLHRPETRPWHGSWPARPEPTARSTRRPRSSGPESALPRAGS